MKSSQSHLPSLLSALLFIVGAMVFFSVALITGITALATLLAGKEVHAQQTILCAVSGFEALILLVATFISIQRYRQQPFTEQDFSFHIGPWQIVFYLLVMALVVFLGYQFGEKSSFNWIILPILTIPAVALPIIVLLGLGIRGIPLGARWQSWGAFGIAMTLSPFLLIIFEVFAMIVIVILAVAFILSQPRLVNDIEHLSRQIQILGPQSEALQDLLLPYLTKPGVMIISLVYVAALVPMIEELIKPLGVWFFARRLTSPAQGFAFGALSGAAYALIETLGVSGQTEGWATLLLSRIGTGILHITTTALMGAAIVYAVRERHYLRLLITYFLAISMHGLWNALAVIYTFATLGKVLNQKTAFNQFQTPLVVGMSVLALIYLVILVFANNRIRATLPKPVLEEPTP